MFVSFFPRPKLFFLSAIAWAALAMTVWYSFAGELFGSSEAVVGVSLFWTARSLWFDLYFALAVAIFAGGWTVFAPHPWSPWSILGSALILFATYFQVQVSVAINSWFGPFYDMVQAALAKTRPVTLTEFYGHLSTFASIALVAVVVAVMTRFFVSHYIFRWRTAMNEFYISYWPKLRIIEGASQRVQEDTMRFATTMENLAVELISAIMTLMAFLPVLAKLSSSVGELPLVGSIPYPLVIAAVLWSVLGTGLLALIGIRLPGIGVLQPAGRSRLPQGTGARRRRAGPGRSADAERAVCKHSKELFPALSELHVFQHRTHRLPSDRRRLRLHPAWTNHRGRRHHAWHHEPDYQGIRPGPNFLPVSHQFLEHDRRVDFDL